MSGTGKHIDRVVHVPGPHAYGSAGAVRKNVLRPVFARDARSEKMLENFDRALQHPDAEDLSHLTSAVTAGCKPV